MALVLSKLCIFLHNRVIISVLIFSIVWTVIKTVKIVGVWDKIIVRPVIIRLCIMNKVDPVSYAVMTSYIPDVVNVIQRLVSPLGFDGIRILPSVKS